jgi:hypothetical protein
MKNGKVSLSVMRQLKGFLRENYGLELLLVSTIKEIYFPVILTRGIDLKSTLELH